MAVAIKRVKVYPVKCRNCKLTAVVKATVKVSPVCRSLLERKNNDEHTYHHADLSVGDLVHANKGSSISSREQLLI